MIRCPELCPHCGKQCLRLVTGDGFRPLTLPAGGSVSCREPATTKQVEEWVEEYYTTHGRLAGQHLLYHETIQLAAYILAKDSYGPAERAASVPSATPLPCSLSPKDCECDEFIFETKAEADAMMPVKGNRSKSFRTEGGRWAVHVLPATPKEGKGE